MERAPTISDVGSDSVFDEETFQDRLGRLIVEFRLLRGITQEQLAHDLGRSTAALSRWENGHSTPTLHDGHKLAELLDAPPEFLLNPPVLPDRPASPLEPLLAALDHQSGRDAVRAALQRLQSQRDGAPGGGRRARPRPVE
jgi:transcriptional regulator with XRE-family HTH domain